MVKRNLKLIVGIFIGILITGSIGVAIAISYNASDIIYTPSDNTWNVSNVDSAINDLNNRTKESYEKVCTFQESEYGNTENHLSVGSKYLCDPGDDTERYFYVLSVRDKEVDLIMEQNIAPGTMDWYSAMEYFTNNQNGVSIKNSWTNVLNIDLPKAQDIANAVNNSTWKAARNSAWWCLETKKQDSGSSPYCYNNTTNTLWLWDYTRDCSSWNCKHSLDSTWAYGYWTRDAIVNTADAWNVYRYGNLGSSSASDSGNSGVRPVVTIYKSRISQ